MSINFRRNKKSAATSDAEVDLALGDVSVSTDRVADIPSSRQMTADAQLVSQFDSLMHGVGFALRSGKTSLSQRSLDKPKVEGSLFEETTWSVAKAEFVLGQFENEFRKSLHAFEKNRMTDNQSVEQFAYQRVLSAVNFVAIGMMSSKSENISEEIASLTKER